MTVIGSILAGIVVMYAGIKTRSPLWITGCTITAFAFLAFGVLYYGLYGLK